MDGTGKKLFFLLSFMVLLAVVKSAQRGNSLDSITDHKEWKKLLRTRNNVMGIFANSDKDLSKEKKFFEDVSTEMKGLATLVTINCGEDKKLCKKLKANPSGNGIELRHYKDGDFNKVYDRRMIVKSMVTFLTNPAAEAPWEEEDGADDVVHFTDQAGLNKYIKKGKPMLVMFYAPWCGHCKRMKPEYALAATELKGKTIMAGMDVDKQENMGVRMLYNITGFPTLIYFSNGKKQFNYGGGNTQKDFLEFAKDPQPPQEKAAEPQWSDEESEVVHLTDDDFAEFMEAHPSTLVMFYAPWCGHCKKMKPDYVTAAAQLKTEEIEGVIAAVDATKHPAVAKKYEVKGYPTVKYFKDGEVAFDVNKRTADDIVAFMKDPEEPPPPPPAEPEWEETESDVIHLNDDNFKSELKKKKHGLVMFYAPWCGHCKKAKPEYENAASKFTENKKVAFAAIDCTKAAAVCKANDVSGYPTFKYYNYGKNDQKYTGGREEADFVNFMSDPLNPLASAPALPDAPEVFWADVEGEELLSHLTFRTFDSYVQTHDPALVLFYATHCKHSQKMRSDWGLAARQLGRKNNKLGHLATVDTIAEPMLAQKYHIKEYPTMKYFKNGEFQFNYEGKRTELDILKFMRQDGEDWVYVDEQEVDPDRPRSPPPEVVDGEWAEVPSAIHHLDEDSFDGFISDKSYVLVMFYAPWCGHCKVAKPHFQDAANTLKNLPDKYFAAFDCKKYKDICKEQGIKGYPTFHLYSNGQFLSAYNGARDRDDFTKFMKYPPAAPQKDEL